MNGCPSLPSKFTVDGREKIIYEEPVRAVLDERDRWRSNTTKFLINECVGLSLKWHEGYEKWHAYSNGIPINRHAAIEITGTILHRKDTSKNLELHVFDGTETIKVLYDSKSYTSDRNSRKFLNKFFGITDENEKIISRLMKRSVSCNKDTGASNTKVQRVESQHKLWWDSSENGTLGKELEEGDYVNVFGFCCPDGEKTKLPSMWVASSATDMIFKAVHVDAISEEMYEKKFKEIFDISTNIV